MSKLWVFRLSLDSAGEPQSDMCFANTDMNYIKDRVKELKEVSKSPDDVETIDVTIELLTNDFIEKGNSGKVGECPTMIQTLIWT